MAYGFNPLIFSGLDLTGGGPAGAAEWREPVANEAALPLVGNANGEARVTLDTDKIYVWDAAISRWVDTGITTATFGSAPNSDGQTIGVDDSTPNIRRRILTLQPADASNPGGISTTSQSIAGAKTFTDAVKIDEASDQLVLGTSTTTTLNAPNPSSDRTVTIPDAGTNSSVVLTESNQTINGTKTFSSTVITDGGIDVTATAGVDTLTIGGTNADIINLGHSGVTVNIVGTTLNQDVINLNVEDKNITLNSGGPAGSGATSGIDVEEAGSITGYVEVSGDRNSWVLKAPNSAGTATITPGASGITIDESSSDLLPLDGSRAMVGDLDMGDNDLINVASVSLKEPAPGSNSVTIQSPSLAGSYTLTLPSTDGVLNQFLKTDGSGVLSFDYQKHSDSIYHVSADGRSEYTSIQAAITAAEAAGPSFSSPKFILIHGSFTEDLVISKTGIMLIGESSQRNHFNRITGSLTVNKLSNSPDSAATQSLVYVGGLYFTKNSDNFIQVSGLNPLRVLFEGCIFYSASSSIAQITNTGTNSKVSFINCTVQVGSSAVKPVISASSAWVDIQNCLISSPALGGIAVLASGSSLITSRNTEFDGYLGFSGTSTGVLGTSTIATTSGPAITTTSSNVLGIAVGNSSFTVPFGTNSITGTGYVYHANNINGGLGGGFSPTVAAIGLTTDTGNLRLPNRGNITLFESLVSGQNSFTITPPTAIASNLTYTVPDVGANADFVMTEGTQTIGGAKTFSDPVTATVNYTPADATDWLSPAPTTVAGGLDALADKIVQYDEVTKEPTGFPNTTDSVTSFNDGSRLFTIQPTGASFDVYVKGKKFTKTTAQTLTVPALAGNHYIYFDSTGALASTQTLSSTLFSDNALVSVVYWNTDTNSRSYFAEERHGLVMDGATHTYLHTVFGARYLSGLALQNFSVDGDGSSDSHAQFDADSGSMRDEDILIQIAAQAQIPILYRQGQLWRKKASDAFPVIYSGTAGYTGASGRLPYNQFTGGSWQLTEIVNNGFVLVHFFGTNDKDNPVVGIQGTAEYNNVSAARTAANSEISALSGLPFAEFVPIGSVVFESSDSYSNTPLAIVRSVDSANYVDFRGTQLYTPAGTATTHGLLSGLANDDHTQYVLADGTRSITGDLTLANQSGLKLSESSVNGNEHVEIQAPSSIATSFTFTLPNALPASSDLALVSSTSGDISYLYVVPASSEDIKRTSFTAADNQAVAVDVTGLAFTNAVTRGFEAQITIVRGSSYAEYSLKGIQKASSWEMSQEYVGDDTGISFSITSLGQIQYTSTSTGNTASILFRAQTV